MSRAASPATLSPEAQGHLAMLVFSALVAGSFSFGARIANDIDPLALTFVRFMLASALIGALVAASGRLLRVHLAAPWRYGVLGALFGVYFVFMFDGLKTAPPVSTAAVFTLIPVMAAGFGWLFLRQILTGRMALALGIGAAGALWVIFRADLAAFLAFEIGRGEAVYFVGCIAHAAYAALVARLNRGEPALVFTFGMLIAGTLVLAVASAPATIATDWLALPLRVWATILYLSVFASAASFVLLQFASLRLPAAKVLAYTYLTPSWVILWEIALGAGVPPARMSVGVALTIAALLMLLKSSARRAETR